jgi:uncharacterized membrane protein YdbT with pleckstrin-like domain
VSYVERVLQSGETVRHTSTIHWVVYLPGFALILVAVVGGVYADGLAENARTIALAGAGAVAAIGLLSLIGAWFQRWTTELAVTDKRIIFKRGFIRRRTIEMNMDKVESVDVDQSVLGRMLDYGDITIRGTGTGIEPLKGIDSPIDFRNQVTPR